MAQADSDIIWVDKAEQPASHLLQVVLDAFPIRVFWKDRDLNYLGCNRLFAHDAGLDSPAEILGKDDFSMGWAEQAELYRADDRRVMESGEAKLNYEEPQDGPDGKKLWLRTNKIPLRDERGTIIGVMGTYEDITAQKELELDLERHRRHLEELVRERTAELEATHARVVEVSRHAGMAEVATNVLHNAGNVLNSINVSVEQLQEQNASHVGVGLGKLAGLLGDKEGADLADFLTQDPRGQRVPRFISALATTGLEQQAQSGRELSQLLSHVAHVKQIVALQQNYVHVNGVEQACDLNDLIRDAIVINLAGVARHRVKLIEDLGEVPEVIVDRNRILQILVNLISNAKYAHDDGTASEPHVIVRSRFVDGRACVVVEDNGTGIPAENLVAIFAHGFTTRAEGHGFGLHGSALAAKEIGGSLTARSDGSGRGATFTLEFPISPPRARLSSSTAPA